MARAPNPFYGGGYPTDPSWAGAGASLATALFGDPEMAAEARLRDQKMAGLQAQAEADRARAGYSTEQTRGLRTQNDAAISLPELIAGLVARPAPQATPAPTADIPGMRETLADAVLAEGTASQLPQAVMPMSVVPPMAAPMPGDLEVTAPSFDPAAFQQGLPALFAAMGQMQGDKIDPNAIIGGLAAMFGNDEFARRGMVGQGKTPGENFALTPDRADDIRDQGYTADYRKATDVAGISAGARRYAADRNLEGTKYTSDNRLEGTRYTSDGRNVVGNGVDIVRQLFGVEPTSGYRGPDHPLSKANPGSFHASTHGAVDVAPIAGMTFEQYVQRIRDAGYPIVEAKNEVGAGRSAHATGDHWHVVIGKPTGKAGGGAKAAPKPKAVPPAQMAKFDEEILSQMGIDKGTLSPRAMTMLRSRAVELYQQTGNPSSAVSQSIKEANDRGFKQRQAGQNPKPTARAASKPANVIRYDAQGNRLP